MWPTPTPWPTPDATPQVLLDAPSMFVDMAEQGVGIWQTGNQYGLMDGIMIVLIIILLVVAIRNITRKIQEM